MPDPTEGATASSTRTDGHAGDRWVAIRCILSIVAVVAAINFITVPAEEYAGDAMSVRAGTIELINHGRLSVPESIASLGSRGEYFYQHPTGSWCSKYGIANTFICLLPLWAEKRVTGEVTIASDHTIYLNLFNVLAGALSAAYLALLAQRYTKSRLIAWIFVITSLYSTFWWNYLRAQTFEVYLTLFLIGFYYHFSILLNEHSKANENVTRHALTAAAYLGVLCLCKTLYVILLPILAGIMVIDERTIRTGLSLTSREHWLDRRFALFWLLVGLCPLLLLATNWYRFGSAFATGYTQSEGERQIFTTNVLPAMWGFVASKQKSIFFHFSVFVLALAGWPTFFKRNKAEAIAIAAFPLF